MFALVAMLVAVFVIKIKKDDLSARPALAEQSG